MATFLRTTKLSVILMFVFLEKLIFRTNCSIFIFRVVLLLEFSVEQRCCSPRKFFHKATLPPTLNNLWTKFNRRVFQVWKIGTSKVRRGADADRPSFLWRNFVFFCWPFGFVIASLSLRRLRFKIFDHCQTISSAEKRHSLISTMQPNPLILRRLEKQSVTTFRHGLHRYTKQLGSEYRINNQICRLVMMTWCCTLTVEMCIRKTLVASAYWSENSTSLFLCTSNVRLNVSYTFLPVPAIHISRVLSYYKSPIISPASRQ